MRAEEYAIMHDVEDYHWWYRSLRAIVARAWRRFVPDGCDSLTCCDVGCGTGANLLLAATWARVAGLDRSSEALRLARARGIAPLACGDVMQLPLADDRFDVVFSMDVLYHRDVANAGAALREMGRILRPGGLLFLNVPAYEWLRSPHDEAIHTGRRFTKRQVSDLLWRNGFEIRWLTYWNALLLPAIAIARMFRAHLGGSEESDLRHAKNGMLNRICVWALAIERIPLFCVPLPFGVSIFGVARKRIARS